MTNRYIYLFAAMLLMGATSCRKLSSYDMPVSSVSMYQIIKDDPTNFSYFKYAIDRASLGSLFSDGGDYTVFAPTNSAFLAAGFTQAAIQALSMDSLTRLVKNHIVQGKTDVRAITGTRELTALSGEKIMVQKVGNAIYVDGADITNPKNEVATNGVLNVINKPLISKATILERLSTYINSTANSTFTFLAAAIARASTGTTNYTQLLGDPNAAYTFFAPNNQAFIDITALNTIAKIQATDPNTLDSILSYHLVQGRKTSADLDSMPVNTVANVPLYFDRYRATVSTAGYANGALFANGGSGNMFAAKSVIHSVGRIFPRPVTQNTLDRVRADTSLTFFDAALTKASQGTGMDYVKMLSDAKASYTVYAINNQAFRNAGYASIAAINAEAPAVLSNILKFHILPRRQNSSNFIENSTTATLYVTKNAKGVESATYITITKTGGYKVKGPANPASAVVSPQDVITTNGLLNVINLVLLP